MIMMTITKDRFNEIEALEKENQQLKEELGNAQKEIQRLDLLPLKSEKEVQQLKKKLKIANEGLTAAYMHGVEKGKQELKEGKK